MEKQFHLKGIVFSSYALDAQYIPCPTHKKSKEQANENTSPRNHIGHLNAAFHLKNFDLL